MLRSGINLEFLVYFAGENPLRHFMMVFFFLLLDLVNEFSRFLNKILRVMSIHYAYASVEISQENVADQSETTTAGLGSGDPTVFS